MNVYGFSHDSIIDLREATFDVRPETTCLLCPLLEDEMGEPATTERRERMRALNDEYHHTLGQNCLFRAHISPEKQVAAEQESQPLGIEYFLKDMLVKDI